jgi:hypothetical protein
MSLYANAEDLRKVGSSQAAWLAELLARRAEGGAAQTEVRAAE